MHDNENWQLYSKNGEPVAGEGYTRPDNPEAGDSAYVAASCVWLYRRENDTIEVLLQKRSHSVSRNPDLWDVSAGGHINLGETPAEAAVRESREEIGATIDPEKLEHICKSLSISGKNLFINYYLYDYADAPDDFHFDDEEVSEVKWVSLEELDDFIDKNAKPALRKAKFVRKLTKKFLEKKLEAQ